MKVPFGTKYKGRPVEEMLQDEGYCRFCLSKPWLREIHTPIYEIVVKHFGEPNETPEHNAMQVRFYEDNICLNVLYRFGWLAVVDPTKFVAEKIAEFRRRGVIQFEESEISKLNRWLSSGEPPSLERRVEEGGWDVLITGSVCSSSYNVSLELKTSLGDEFPAVLRQMKINSERVHDFNGCLVYKKFTAVSATLEQVKRVFYGEGFLVFSMEDISEGDTSH